MNPHEKDEVVFTCKDLKSAGQRSMYSRPCQPSSTANRNLRLRQSLAFSGLNAIFLDFFRAQSDDPVRVIAPLQIVAQNNFYQRNANLASL